MDIGLIVIQFVHVAAGAAWFGASLFVNMVVLPFLAARAPARQRELVSNVIPGPERILIGAALAAAVTGLIRGIGFGRIQSMDALMSPYGAAWLVSILVALGVIVTGGRMTSHAARVLRDETAATDAAVRQMIGRVRLGFRIELAGITLILVLMILLPRLQPDISVGWVGSTTGVGAPRIRTPRCQARAD